MARSSTASEPLRLLLLALVACCAAAASICDTVNCARGNCTELPELIPGLPSYECHCDTGWSQALTAFPFSPCIIPKCSFDGACLNLSLSPPKGILPKDVCNVVSCGAGGACKTGGGAALFSYTCECQPGYANMLNLTTLPCVKNCFFGNGCSALGLAPTPVPQPSPSPPLPPAPTAGNHDSSGPSSAPPSGTQGFDSSWRLLQLLLLVTLAMAQVL